MITAGQIRAARALLGIDQRKLAELSGLSLPTIQRMEASEDTIRGNVESLMKLVAAFDGAGIEFDRRGRDQPGGRSRCAAEIEVMAVALVLSCVAVLLATSVLAVGLAPPGRPIVLWRRPCCFAGVVWRGAKCAARRFRWLRKPAPRSAVARCAFPHRRTRRFLSGRGQSLRRGSEPVRARLWPSRGSAAARAAVLSLLPSRNEPRRTG